MSPEEREAIRSLERRYALEQELERRKADDALSAYRKQQEKKFKFDINTKKVLDTIAKSKFKLNKIVIK